MSPDPATRKSGGDSNGIWVAVIGSVATIIVGYLTYLAATHKTDPAQTFVFAGVVASDNGKGVPNARVSVTEDQSTSQTIPTDQYGNFHVQLLQKTQSLSIRVDAGDGYEVVTVDANPHRTGPEVINVHKKATQAPRGDLIRAVTEFEQRLSDVQEYKRQLAPLTNKPLETRQGLSIYIWRVWYGDQAYQNAESEYKNVRWKGVLAKIRELGITEKYAAADKAITEIEEGDIEGQHYTAEYLEPRLNILSDYKDTVLEPAIR
jgi:hypothetical protein